MCYQNPQNTLIAALLFCCLSYVNFQAQAQIAGNVMQSQQKKDSYYSGNESAGGSAYRSFNSHSLEKPYFLSDTIMLLNANVLMNVKADSYVAMFGLAQVAEDLENCNILMNKRVEGFIKALQDLGIPRQKIYVDFVAQVPAFEYEVEKKLFSKTYNEVPKGFELKKNIHIGYTANDLLDKMLSAAAQYEIYDVIKVDYIINNPESVYDSLRSVAIRLLNKKVEDFKKLGIKFNTNEYQLVAEQIKTTYPIDCYDSYTAFTNPNMSAVKKSVGSVVQLPKTQTIYYNHLPYHEFDVVINPQLIEPAAQFSYMLQVKYVLRKQ